MSAAGSEASPVTALDASRQEVAHGYPQFLPDGRHFLYWASSYNRENGAVYLGALDSKETTRLLRSEYQATCTQDATGQGYLLFVRERALLAQRFDTSGWVLQGDPFPVAEDVTVSTGPSRTPGAKFSSSANGVLSYQRGGTADRELVWFDRSGQRLSSVGEPANYSNLALSPDERRLAISREDAQLNTRDIWIFELDRDLSTRFTFDRGDDVNPIWSPDGLRIAFTSTRTGPRTLYVKDANGTGEAQALFESDENRSTSDWSPDGLFILAGGNALPFDARRKPIPLPPEINNPKVSPGGRWLAYQSEESGRFEIYVQSFPALLAGRPAGKRQVSTAGGGYAEWRRDGQELFYVAPDNTLMAASVKVGGPALETGLPTPLFPVRIETASRRAHFQPAANGQRFLVVQVPEQASSPITVVVNWMAELAR